VLLVTALDDVPLILPGAGFSYPVILVLMMQYYIVFLAGMLRNFRNDV
jgi:hypothetical protein